MANFEFFLMIYVLVFYYEIRRMPGEAGYCFYGLVLAPGYNDHFLPDKLNQF